jgi:hypothetical protein
MTIELWAKMIDRGHCRIGTVEVPDNCGYIYRMPVRPDISLKSSFAEVTPSQPIFAERIFEWTPAFLDERLGSAKRYLER